MRIGDWIYDHFPLVILAVLGLLLICIGVAALVGGESDSSGSNCVTSFIPIGKAVMPITRCS